MIVRSTRWGFIEAFGNGRVGRVVMAGDCWDGCGWVVSWWQMNVGGVGRKIDRFMLDELVRVLVVASAR